MPRGARACYALRLSDCGGRARALAGRRCPTACTQARLYEPEKRPFWPHVTLARAKRGKLPAGSSRPTLPPELRSPFEAGAVTLYRSTLRPQGAVYEPLAKGKKTPVH